MPPIPLFAAFILLGTATLAFAQEPSPQKRSFLGRLLHPFNSAEKVPEYRNPKLRGLVLSVQIPSEPVKLAEVRQLPVSVLLSNRGDRAVELSFPTEQRIEILLHNAAGQIVTAGRTTAPSKRILRPFSLIPTNTWSIPRRSRRVISRRAKFLPSRRWSRPIRSWTRNVNRSPRRKKGDE